MLHQLTTTVTSSYVFDHNDTTQIGTGSVYNLEGADCQSVRDGFPLSDSGAKPRGRGREQFAAGVAGVRPRGWKIGDPVWKFVKNTAGVVFFTPAGFAVCSLKQVSEKVK